MTKICTSLEQSKKLLKLGIDVNTADMFYRDNGVDVKLMWEHLPDVQVTNPAWSLTALLGLMPSEIYGETIYGDTITYEVDFRKYKLTDDVDLYQIAYGSIKFDVDGQYSFKDMVNTGQKEDPIDAAFEMVCWLLESHHI